MMVNLSFLGFLVTPEVGLTEVTLGPLKNLILLGLPIGGVAGTFPTGVLPSDYHYC